MNINCMNNIHIYKYYYYIVVKYKEGVSLMPKAEINVRNEFKEIMNDFTNPLEIFREAIQNSLDEKSKVIKLLVENNDTSSGDSVDITIEDDGNGISLDNFSNFFDLGNSTKVNKKECIGEKGHGTKIFYNSNKVTLESWINHKKYISELNNPYKNIYENKELDYTLPKEVENVEKKEKGIRIKIEGYLKNTSNSPIQRFSHPAIKDYILWFTGFGSILPQFNIEKHDNYPILYLKSYDSKTKKLQEEFNFKLNDCGYEEIKFGHIFPSTEIIKTNELKSLAKQHSIRNWEQLFCKKLFCDEITIDGIQYPVQILIWVEGDKCKRLYNPLIKERVNSSTRAFQYKVSDRYGFWVCKNFIPIQKVDSWITGKGSYTKFHAFINYNKFNLTANRSSIENTKPEDLSIIQEKVDKLFQEVIEDRQYKEWRDIEERAAQERSAEMEQKEFGKRIKACCKRKKIQMGNQMYFEPTDEGEVALLFNGILENFTDVLNVEILDYNTYKGIDFLVRDKSNTPILNDRTIGYIELKLNLLKTRFNHSFKNLRKIVCYNAKGLTIDDIIIDLNGEHLIVKKNKGGYFLSDYNNEVGHNIDILILKDFLDKKGLKFE
jgi:hypothetical protein